MPDMHTRFDTEIDLPVPPEAAWEALRNMNRWRAWTDVFDVADGTPSDTWRQGIELQVGPQLLGLRLWADVTITRAEPPRRLTWRGDLFGIPGRHGFVFEATDRAGCRMTQWEACGGLGGYLAVGSGAWRLLRRRFERFNRDLRNHLEEGS